jgi:hypothetical protein
MAQVVLDCPVCGLPLLVMTLVTKPGTDTVKNGEVGGHIHIEASGTTNCVNAHRWDAAGTFILTRT